MQRFSAASKRVASPTRTGGFIAETLMFERIPRSHVLVHSTSTFVRLARLDRQGDAQRVSAPEEFHPDDATEQRRWLKDHTADAGNWISGYCGYHPGGTVLLREDILIKEQPPKLATFNAMIERRSRSQMQGGWRIGVVDALTGAPLSDKPGPASALVIGLPRNELAQHQKHLLKQRIRPRRLELDTLSTLGAIRSQFKEQLATATIALCEFGPRETVLYFLDRKGIHPQDPLPFGLQTLAESAQRDLKLETLDETEAALDQPDEALHKKLPRLLRIYANHLRLALDYYEHQTGRIVGSIYPCNLPLARSWLGPALAAAIDLNRLEFDLLSWANEHGLELATLPANPTDWLPTLVLATTPIKPDHGKAD